MVKQSASRRAGLGHAHALHGAERLMGEATRFRVLIAFLGLLLLAGGGSRADITSLVFLRPVAFALLAYAILSSPRQTVVWVRGPVLLLAVFAMLIGLQLVPLPPAIWGALPQRGIFSQMYGDAQVALPWLPLGLAPSRGLNALMALAVPAAALLLQSSLSAGRRRQVCLAILGGVVVSSLWGLLQILGPANGPLYTFRITNAGLPVGFFANRNHQGLAISFGVLLSVYWFAASLANRRLTSLVAAAAGGLVIVLLMFLLVVGSRAGLLLGTAMLGPGAFMVVRALEIRSRPNDPTVWSNRTYRTGFAAFIAAVAAVFAGALVFSRSLAFDRLVGKSMGDELRAEVLPALLNLTGEYLPLGTGFGAFEGAYRRAEPLQLLSPSYLNHAHNDWVEFVIEGGIPAILLIVAFVVWFIRRAVPIVFAKRAEFNFEAFTAVVIIVACGVSSLVDYPLRVPALAAVFAIACASLALSSRRT